MFSDAYTMTGEVLSSPDAIKKSIYNYTNRYSPLSRIDCAHDGRMILYGLSDFLEEIKPITHDWINQVCGFMSSACSLGGSLPFPEKTFRRIVDEYDGWLPITIKSLPEGSVFYPNEPIIEVESEEGFGEIAAYVEPLLVGSVSIATAKSTICRHLLERLYEETVKYNPHWTKEACLEHARWMAHDFGMRASSCEAESNLLGRAHLLSFYGTDTFNAAFKAWQLGAKRPTGTSILALAHRIVQGWTTELGCFENLNKYTIGSYVADCYNFKNAVNELIKMALANPNHIVVVRPDSGDYIENTKYIVKKALEAGLYSLDQGVPVPTNLKYIHGDSMNYDKIRNVFNTLNKLKVNPTRWGIFGIGGWLRNTPTRDLLSSAYKLANCGRHVVKLSETPDKMSIPGPCSISRVLPSVSLSGEDLKIKYYSNGWFHKENFQDIIDRTIEFKESFWKGYGLNRSCLSEEIKQIQNGFVKKYRS